MHHRDANSRFSCVRDTSALLSPASQRSCRVCSWCRREHSVQPARFDEGVSNQQAIMTSVQHDRVTAEQPGSCRAGHQPSRQREELQTLPALPVAAGERHMTGLPFPWNRHRSAPEVPGIPAGTYLVAPKAVERSRRSRVPTAPSCDLPTNAPVSVPSSPPVSKKTFPSIAIM